MLIWSMNRRTIARAKPKAEPAVLGSAA